MTQNIYQGDPRLVMTKNGMTFQYTNGQPLMDAGWENAVLISLFTRKLPGKPGFYGNIFAKNDSQKIGSYFEYELNQPVTLNQLNKIRDAGEKALQWMIDDGYASRITLRPTVPASDRMEILIIIEPLGQDLKILLLKKNGLNWVAQKLDPAYLRLKNGN